MSYQVLARKWRPGNFGEMVGQEHVVRALTNALDNDRLHHAYLFTGTRGVGKTTLARILAKSLNCESGVTSTPCGECTSCREIDDGRFVDLLEVDAASRTKVDQTRELLDQVPYAPVRGRYKVYLIDEVHMFSDSSFNALLKTLEEPPPHVKFLLATTDPQKVPVTVLSRCLQFNLKRLPIDQIQGQFAHILAAEGVESEAAALFLLARAADGSMRDGLSLLDQAIGFGGGAISDLDAKAMLGVIAIDRLPDLLTAVHVGAGAQVLDLVAELNHQAPDFAAVLRDLLTLLHRVAIVQGIPDAEDPSWGEPERVRELAALLSPEDAQLYYQIGLLGQRDLPFAPDPRSGFEMVLLRMMVFRPSEIHISDTAVSSGRGTGDGSRQKPAQTSANPTAADTEARRTSTTESTEDRTANSPACDLSDWHRVLPELGLGGMAAQLASNCTVTEWDGKRLVLGVDPACQGLVGSKAESNLRDALAGYTQHAVELVINVATAASETPARRRLREQEQRQQAAVAAMHADPLVKALEDKFDAELVDESIRPAKP